MCQNDEFYWQQTADLLASKANAHMSPTVYIFYACHTAYIFYALLVDFVSLFVNMRLQIVDFACQKGGKVVKVNVDLL